MSLHGCQVCQQVLLLLCTMKCLNVSFIEHILCSKMTFHMPHSNAIQPFDWKYHQNALDTRMNGCFLSPGSLFWIATRCAFISSDLKWGGRVFISYHLTSKFKFTLVWRHQNVELYLRISRWAWGISPKGQRLGRTWIIALMITRTHLVF